MAQDYLAQAPHPGEEHGTMTAAEIEERLRNVEAWAAEHKGRNDAMWSNQNKRNDSCERGHREIRLHQDQKFAAVFKELNQLKVKVAGFAALAAAAGSGIGAGVMSLLQ